MLKLYLCGYLNRVRSNRRLEAEATRNLELIWLLRGLRPDYKTIPDFRRDNRGAFKAVFRAFVAVCRKIDLFECELLAVDGTQNNRGRNFSRDKLARYMAAADERIEGYLVELDAIDRGEDGHGPDRRETLAAKIAHLREQRQVQAAMLEQLTASGKSQISLTDPDARAMVTGQKAIVGYNAQLAVDAKHELIIEQHVTNAATHMGLLSVTAGAAREALGVERIDAVADMGYYKGEDIEVCEANGITPYVTRPERGIAVANGRFPRECFTYGAAADAYHCPGGWLLDTRYRSVIRGHVSIQYSSPTACGVYTIRARCTCDRWRRINRWKNEAVLERIAKRLAARPGIFNFRRETVEHPFGSIKQWMNQGAFLMRRLEKVRAEFSLTALAYSFRRAIPLVGIPGLIRAVRA